VSHRAVYSEAATALTTHTFAALAATLKIGRAAALQQALRRLIRASSSTKPGPADRQLSEPGAGDRPLRRGRRHVAASTLG
jgi:hypothetical protein